MENTRTLFFVKPDGVQRGLVGAIIGRFEQRGLKLVGLKMMQVDRALAERHYAEHVGKGFYEGLLEYITSGPIVVAVVEGPNAAQTVRDTMGATNPLAAAPGTIRFDYGVSIGRNIIHGSANPDDAAREIELYFRPEELVSWTRETDRWVFEQ